MLFFGWNLRQWSLAAGRYKSIVGDLPPATPDAALTVQNWWRSAYPSIEPGENVILLANPVDRATEPKWATAVVTEAMNSLHRGVKPSP